MSYFSRLTDIVTCNLTELLRRADDPMAAIEGIILEMEEGLAGARRSVATASATQDRIACELSEHRGQVDTWAARAREHLLHQREDDARRSLVRKCELCDLIAGLEQQHQAAVATSNHLLTMQRAIEARLSDAQRRRVLLREGRTVEETVPSTGACAHLESSRYASVDAELEALRREVLG